MILCVVQRFIASFLMARKLRRKIGEILIDHGAISKENLEIGLEKASGTAKKIGEVLIELGYCDEAAIVKGLAECDLYH